jgi:hypothetical protein
VSIQEIILLATIKIPEYYEDVAEETFFLEKPSADNGVKSTRTYPSTVTHNLPNNPYSLLPERVIDVNNRGLGSQV